MAYSKKLIENNYKISYLQKSHKLDLSKESKLPAGLNSLYHSVASLLPSWRSLRQGDGEVMVHNKFPGLEFVQIK